MNTKDTSKENTDLLRQVKMLEERIKRLEQTAISQAKLLKEQSVYIVHLRKKNKRSNENN